MSAKQLRKLRELEVRKVQESIKALDVQQEDDEDEEGDDSEDEAETIPVRKSIFATLNATASSGASSSSSSAPSSPRKGPEEGEPSEQPGEPPKAPKRPRRKAKKGAAAADGASEPAGQPKGKSKKAGSTSTSSSSKRKGAAASSKQDQLDGGDPTLNGELAEEEDEIDEDDLLLEQSMQEVRNEFEGDPTLEEGAAAESSDPRAPRPLALRRAHFSYEHERRQAIGGGAAAAVLAAAAGGPGPTQRRMIQARGGVQGRTAHHRRLYLVNPTAEEPWPKPHDCIAMAPPARSDDLSFDFRDTSESVKSLEQLQDCLLMQDPNQLQNFLQRHPFCVDGLLTLADYHRGQSSHEQVFQLSRRAVYALECNFHSSFSPFMESGGSSPSSKRPRVRIQINDDDAWPGWSWFRAFWMYINSLAGQGMQRTALECCRLLLACSLPRDPIYMLPMFDYLCLRSRQYALLLAMAKHLPGEYGLAPEVEDTALQPWLDLTVPNVAFSVALATYLSVATDVDLAALNEVSIDHITHGVTGLQASFDDELSPSARAHALLLRAMLLFPLALRPLLDEANVSIYAAPPRKSPSKTTWGDLLAQPPFADAVSFRHEEHGGAHGRLAMLYAKRCGPLWRADNIHLWLHACAARLTSLFGSSAFSSELGAARKRWSEGQLCLAEALSRDYASMPVEEGQLPNAVEKSIQARLHPPRNFGSFMGLGRFARMDPYGGAPAPTASLHTPPLLLFFQLLLPWVELDRSGTVVQALRWKDVGKGMKKAVTGTLHFLSCLAQDAVTLTREGWDWLLAAME